MKQRPYVSVIVPYYNASRHIGEALASIRAQAYEPLEIIVVDDASDEEHAACPDLIAPDVTLYWLNINGGPAAARNAGLDRAQGELIAFLDADDLWPEGKLAAQVAAMQADPSIDIATGKIKYVWLDGARDPNYKLPEDNTINHVNLGALIARREVFDRIGCFDATKRFSEDQDWWLRAREHGMKVHMADETTLIYRRHEGNMTRHCEVKAMGMLETLKQSLDRRRAKAGAAGNLPAFKAPKKAV
ncbi:MAG: glycosyltransferase [Alphaproteobacteria bacterium]|nr:glycosyltransferase [Alphaproteobacteria bacterium]